jgi:hypothetical protein
MFLWETRKGYSKTPIVMYEGLSNTRHIALSSLLQVSSHHDLESGWHSAFWNFQVIEFTS